MATISQVTRRTELRIQKLAVLTDFSKNAAHALRYAAGLARGCDAAIVLAHAYIPPYSAFAAPQVGLVYQAFHDLQEVLNSRLANETEAAYLRDLRCTTYLREGSPGDLLEDLRDADLIVVGTSGQTGFEKAALGSTAEEIFRSSSIPVLTIGPNCRCTGTTEIALNTVLYATDFSAGAALALPYALSIASEHDAKLILLHVAHDQDAQFSFERTMASVEPLEKLRKLIAYDSSHLLADLTHQPKYLISFGRAGEMIVEEASNCDADLIVIGARGAGRLASVLSHFGGGTAYHVAVNADCPVLTVREK